MYNPLRRNEKSLALPPWVILGTRKKIKQYTKSKCLWRNVQCSLTPGTCGIYVVASLRARVPLLHPVACSLPGCSSAMEGREDLSRSQYSILLSIVYVYDEVFRQLQAASRAAHHKCRDALWLSQRRKKSQHVERVDHT